MSKDEAKTKKLSEWEKERNFMFLGDPAALDKPHTEDEVTALVQDASKVVGVQHDGRIKFLQDNGYDVTRENMVNPNLSAKPKE